MDSRRFDELTRALAASTSRRHLFRMVVGGAVAGALSAIGVRITWAGPCPGGAAACGGACCAACEKCFRRSPSSRRCVPDCPVKGQVCLNGQCTCPVGQSAQTGACTSGTRCCCDDGTLACPIAGSRVCCGPCEACGRNAEGDFACLLTCPGDASCLRGECVCADGRPSCGAAPNATCCAACEQCLDGACVANCPAQGQVCHDGACVCPTGQSVQTDVCGAGDRCCCPDGRAPCPDGSCCGACQECGSITCVSACRRGTECINGACVCPGRQVMCGSGPSAGCCDACEDGQCRCADGRPPCNGVCCESCERCFGRPGDHRCVSRCPTKGQVCAAGQCVCPPGQSAQTGVCTSGTSCCCDDGSFPCPLAAGPACCGPCEACGRTPLGNFACFSACGDGSSCVDGQCTCPDGRPQCVHGADAMCCGRCEECGIGPDGRTTCVPTCRAGATCVGGECVCPEGRVYCGTGPNAACCDECNRGQCVCRGGRPPCNGSCCGSCERCFRKPGNHRCIPDCPVKGQICAAGQCVCPVGQSVQTGVCTSGTRCCCDNGTMPCPTPAGPVCCTDCLACDRTSNGFACVSTCPTPQTCVEGVCECPGAEPPCQGVCCGGCQICDANGCEFCPEDQICVGNECACPPDRQPCGPACCDPAQGQTCRNGICVCVSGDPSCQGACCNATRCETCGPEGCEQGCTGPCEACVEGVCGEVTCADDGDPCTSNVCDPARGGCVADPIPGCCRSDDDCPDDDDPCTDSVCEKSVCTQPPAPDTTPCDTGNPCSTGDHCDGEGRCVPGSARPNGTDCGACKVCQSGACGDKCPNPQTCDPVSEACLCPNGAAPCEGGARCCEEQIDACLVCGPADTCVDACGPCADCDGGECRTRCTACERCTDTGCAPDASQDGADCGGNATCCNGQCLDPCPPPKQRTADCGCACPDITCPNPGEVLNPETCLCEGGDPCACTRLPINEFCQDHAECCSGLCQEESCACKSAGGCACDFECCGVCGPDGACVCSPAGGTCVRGGGNEGCCAPAVCGEESRCCLLDAIEGFGDPCTADDECCSRVCEGGVCRSCREEGGSCAAGELCCRGNCGPEGTCSCTPPTGACSSSFDCCFGADCIAGLCCLPTAIERPGDPGVCPECCSGVCDGEGCRCIPDGGACDAVTGAFCCSGSSDCVGGRCCSRHGGGCAAAADCCNADRACVGGRCCIGQGGSPGQCDDPASGAAALCCEGLGCSGFFCCAPPGGACTPGRTPGDRECCSGICANGVCG